MNKPESVHSVLEHFFSKKGWNSKLKEYRIWTHWSEVVGPKLSNRCYPLKLQNLILTLGVSNSTWLTQLQFMKLELIEKVKEKLQISLKDILFRVQELPPSADKK
ncbi:MAG: DUF721 domain-containing protein [Deltaproteobacteria bacterium]|nr:DUF721 domain-containing protein [Deltaproteobacteria bacterium]MBI3017332.1 DUF721 domain-containing protein [Deltaproteobacteria bacterium]